MADDPTSSAAGARRGVHRELPLLSALERELLAYVERLTQACEASTARFAALEKRSNVIIETRQKALEDGVRSLISSQTSLVEVLHGYAEASADTASAQQSLRASRRALINAETLLNASLPK